MKRFFKYSIAFLLCAVLVLGLIPTNASAAKETEISLWTYPIGSWGNEAQTQKLIERFEADNPGIKVNVRYLNYMDGDMIVDTVIAAGETPDLILEGPERLVSDWGGRGIMVDMSDLLDSKDRSEIYTHALNAGFGAGGKLYLYPLAGTVHTMAINKTVFEAAGAMKYLNEDKHIWNSTEDFFKAVQAVYEHTNKTVGLVYSGGMGGDQGTRALVNNLYGGKYTNAKHTAYTWDSEENIAALQALYDCQGIAFDRNVIGGDEIAMLRSGDLNMAFCWNVAQQQISGTTAMNDEILFMAFPSNTTPALASGMWGFGIFDNHDEDRISAAKTFVKYFCDSAATVDAVRHTGYFPLRSSVEGINLANIWKDDALLNDYNTMMPMMGDYYVVTPRWRDARQNWIELLNEVGMGGNIAEAAKKWTLLANGGVEIKEEQDAPEIKAGNVSSSGKIKISWDAVEGAAKYKVYRATSKNGTYSRVITTTNTSYTNTSAKAGTRYYYYVVAVADDGTESAKSNIVSRTCDLAKPVITTENVASSGKIKVSWKAVDGAKEYKVYRATSKTGTYKLVKTTTSTSYTNTSAEAGKAYYYKVKAIHSNDEANSAYSEIKSRTCDLARPVVSIKLSSKGKPSLSWKKIEGAKEYKVYRATSKTGTYKLVKTTTSTSYTNTAAVKGKTYYYKVVAVHSKSAANSAYSLVDSMKSK